MTLPIRQAEVPWIQGYDFGVGVDLVSTSPMARVVQDVHSAAAPGATVQFQVQRIRTTSDLEQALNIDVDASYGSAMFGAGAKARFDFAKSAQVQTSSLFMSVTAVVKLGFLSIDDPQLTPNAATLIDHPDIFTQRFGDTFVRGILMGGLFVGVIRIETKSSNDTENISSELSGTYGLFSADAKVKFQEVQSKYNASSFVQMYHEGGPVDLEITDTTDPGELLRNANMFLQSFKDTPQAVATAYQVTLAPISIAQGPLPPNEIDLQQLQDVLTFCAKRRSVMLDQLNNLQYITDNPDRYDFSTGASIDQVRQTLVDTQTDLDLIAQCASAAINHPEKAELPVDFAKANGSVFPKAVLPSPMPTSKVIVASTGGTATPPVGRYIRPTPTYSTYGMLVWGGWRTQADVGSLSNDDARNLLITQCSNLALVPSPALFQSYNNSALVGKASVMIFLLQTRLRSADQLKITTVDAQRAALVVWHHDRSGIPIEKLQTFADQDIVDGCIPFAFDLGIIAGQTVPF